MHLTKKVQLPFWAAELFLVIEFKFVVITAGRITCGVAYGRYSETKAAALVEGSFRSVSKSVSDDDGGKRDL